MRIHYEIMINCLAWISVPSMNAREWRYMVKWCEHFDGGFDTFKKDKCLLSPTIFSSKIFNCIQQQDPTFHADLSTFKNYPCWWWMMMTMTCSCVCVYNCLYTFHLKNNMILMRSHRRPYSDETMTLKSFIASGKLVKNSTSNTISSD